MSTTSPTNGIPKSAQLIIGQYITKFNGIDRQVNEVEVHKSFLIRDLAERIIANGYATKEIIFEFLCDALIEVVDEDTIIRSLPKGWVHDSVIGSSNRSTTPKTLSDEDLNVIKQVTAEFQKHVNRLTEENDLLRKRHKEDTIQIKEISAMCDSSEYNTTRMERIASEKEVEVTRLKEENSILKRELDEQKQQKQQKQQQKQIYIEASEMVGLFVMEAQCIKKEKKQPQWNPSGDRNRKIIFDVNNKTGQVEGCHLEP
jgi:predicted RNase H-like nuclease (RuvC/YqgF family)